MVRFAAMVEIPEPFPVLHAEEAAATPQSFNEVTCADCCKPIYGKVIDEMCESCHAWNNRFGESNV